MSTEKMREEFEAWAIKDAASVGVVLSPVRHGEWYGHDRLNTAWAAWQASRAALVIELPSECPPEKYNDESMANGFNDGVEACRECIESCGLKVAQ